MPPSWLLEGCDLARTGFLPRADDFGVWQSRAEARSLFTLFGNDMQPFHPLFVHPGLSACSEVESLGSMLLKYLGNPGVELRGRRHEQGELPGGVIGFDLKMLEL